VQCQITGNQQGGILVADRASLLLESCEICGNGHFGVVAGLECGALLLGRTNLSANASGSLWHCGGSQASPSSLSWLDQCSLSGSSMASSSTSSPAVVVGVFVPSSVVVVVVVVVI
ncbi:unnamed protein product, partial [Polarella glacialis]